MYTNTSIHPLQKHLFLPHIHTHTHTLPACFFPQPCHRCVYLLCEWIDSLSPNPAKRETLGKSVGDSTDEDDDVAARDDVHEVRQDRRWMASDVCTASTRYTFTCT